MNFKSILINIFTLDLRSLAIMRIAMALLILLDLSIRFTDIKVFYSDQGVMPLSILFSHSWNPFNFSIHTASGLWQIQAIIFLINTVFALMLLVGYKTRLTGFLCWLLMLSLHNRNPLILQGGDDLFRMILFWGIFLPWGKIYSIDAFRKPHPENFGVFNFATVGYLLQLLSVYFFAALLKTSPEWRSEGTAIYYALSLDQLVFPLGKLIYPFPNLLKFLTLSVWYLELLAPVLFLIPFKNSFFKKAGILLIASLHLGISLSLFVGLFFLIGWATLLGAMPTDWAQKIDRILLKNMLPAKKIIVPFIRLRNYFFKVRLRIISPVKKPRIYRNTANFSLVAVIVYTLVYNWHTCEIPLLTKENISKMDWFGHSFKFTQKWGMFSPGVFKADGWYIYEAVAENGDIIDINREGRQVNYDKPRSVVSLFKNDRWRKYGENYIYISHSFMRPKLAEFLFKEWNKKNPDRKINSLRVIYMMELTLPDYKESEITREELAVYPQKNGKNNK
jgi:hypothetical protein